MAFSELLRKNLVQAKVGGIIYPYHRFRHKRRATLFFEELFARFVLECEKNGAESELIEIGRKWMFLCFHELVPETIKKIPAQFLLNNILRRFWHNSGLMDDFHIEKNDDIIKINTKNEGVTRYIGPNGLMVGFYIGVINALFHSSAQPLKIRQEKESCQYIFKLSNEPFFVDGKSKELYRRLNEIASIKGYTLKDSLREKTFTIKENRIYFRGKSISPVENTLFHLVSNSNLFPEKISEVSYSFFNEIIKEDSTKEGKISLLKNIFQVMGWGIINVVIKEKKIVIEIKNPPYGLTITDNWEYIIRTFLGYLWLFDRKLKMSNINQTGGCVSAEYSH